MLYRIGDCYLDSDSGQISLDKTLPPSNSSQLEHTPLNLLLCLVKYQGRDVTKDTMLNEVWTNKVVTEDVLTVAMSQIRRALGDSARTPKYVKTIPGIGYRLIATVQKVHNEHDNKITEQAIRTKKPLYNNYISSALIVIALITLMLYFFTSAEDPPIKGLTTTELQSDYQKARYLLTQSDERGWLDAKQIFEDSIIKEPNFAASYRDLVDVKLKLIENDSIERYRQLDEYYFLLNKSLSLAPSDHQTHLLLAHVAYQVEWNFELANEHFIEAINLEPEDASAHFMYAKYLLAAGEFELSLKHTKKYIELDPEWYAVPMVAWIYNMMGEYDLALSELKKLQSINPTAFVYHVSAHSILENTGNQKASFNELLEIFKQKGYSKAERDTTQRLFKTGGLSAINSWLLNDKKEQQNIGQGHPPLSFARYAIKAGETDRAVEFILQAFEQRQGNLLTFNVDPVYKNIQNHPKLKNLINPK